MKKYILLFLAFTTFRFHACKDDEIPTENDQNPALVQLTHMPLAVGNKWVYEYVRIDTNGRETPIFSVDSVMITRDSVIRGHKYFVLVGTDKISSDPALINTPGIIGVYRDSLGYLANSHGKILFSETNFSDTFNTGVLMNNNDTIAFFSSMMMAPKDSVEVPAGKFKALDFQQIIYFPDPKIGGGFDYRYRDRMYADHVGLILRTDLFSGSPSTVEKRLIRFHVN